MTHRNLRCALFCLLSLPLLAGCDQIVEKVLGKKSGQAEKDKKAAAADEDEEDKKPEKKKAEPPNPNDAFFTTGQKKHTLHRVRAGALTKLELGKCSNVDNMVMDTAGTAWIQCFDGLYRTEGDEVVAVDTPIKRPKITRGRDGSLWLSASKPAALYKRDGENWKLVPVPDGLELTWKLVVDSKGRPWASTKGAVFVREGETWQPAPLEKNKPEDSYTPKIVATDDGMVWVLTDKHRFVGIEADGKVGRRTYPNYREPIARTGGGVIIEDSSWGRSMQVIDAKGKQEKSIVFKGKVFYDGQAYDSERVISDTQGRLWIGSRYGLIIAQPDGALDQWEPGRLEGFSGSNVEHLAVGGTGPELPKLGPKVRGTVKGKVDISKPTKVELCSGGIGFSSGGTRKFYGATPCASKPVAQSMKTDKEGNFEFKDVPPYEMSVLIQSGARNWADRDAKCCSDLKAGETRDIGSLKP